MSCVWQPLPPLSSPLSLSPPQGVGSPFPLLSLSLSLSISLSLLHRASFFLSLSLSRLCSGFLPLSGNRLWLASLVPPLIRFASLSLSRLCSDCLPLFCLCSGNKLRLSSSVVRARHTSSSSLSLSCNTSSSLSPSLSLPPPFARRQFAACSRCHWFASFPSLSLPSSSLSLSLPSSRICPPPDCIFSSCYCPTPSSLDLRSLFSASLTSSSIFLRTASLPSRSDTDLTAFSFATGHRSYSFSIHDETPILQLLHSQQICISSPLHPLILPPFHCPSQQEMSLFVAAKKWSTMITVPCWQW